MLSAEPAIRSLQQWSDGRLNITVSAGDVALFRNHPGVRQIVDRRAWRGGQPFDMCLKLGPESDPGGSRLVDTYARRLGVQLTDRHPRIYLDGFDVLRMQRFTRWRSESRRIVIGPGSCPQDKVWDDSKWLELCDYLANKLGATLIQVGRRGESFLGYGYDFVGKLTPREVATVLKDSDFMIGVDNAWRHLAVAVGRPAVVLTDAASDLELQPEGCVAVHAEGGVSGSAVRDIAIEAVLDGMAKLHGQENFRDFERAVCA